MKARINTSGTHIRNGVLKVRVDLYPDPSDKTYPFHHVDKFDREPTEEELADPSKLALVPVHQELNPCLCHFIEVPEDVTGEQLLAFLARLFTPDCLAALDEAMVQPDAAHRISPYMRTRPKLTPVKVQSADTEALIAGVNTRLSGLEANLARENGEPESIEPGSIDVGPGTGDFDSRVGSYYTAIDLDNPANATGEIDTIQVWLNIGSGGCYGGSFYHVSGTTYHCRDAESLGEIAAGSTQTITGLGINISTGEYIGFYAPGRIELNTTGGVGVQYVNSNACVVDWEGATNTWSDRKIAIYGTGAESGGVTEKTSGDSGSGAEASGAHAALAASESGSGAESPGPRSFGLADTGTGVEGTVGGMAALVAGDYGQATEYAHILGLWETLFGQDAGRGSDSLRALAVRGGHETGLRAGPGRVGLPQKEVKL